MSSIHNRNCYAILKEMLSKKAYPLWAKVKARKLKWHTESVPLKGTPFVKKNQGRIGVKVRPDAIYVLYAKAGELILQIREFRKPCSICNKMLTLETRKLMGCGHAYCEECRAMWWKHKPKNTCPKCV